MEHGKLKKNVHIAFKGVSQDDPMRARKALAVVRHELLVDFGIPDGKKHFERVRLAVGEALKLTRLGKKLVAAKAGLLSGDVEDLFREWRFNNEFIISRDKALARLVNEAGTFVSEYAKDETNASLRKNALDALNRISEHLEKSYEKCMNKVLQIHRDTFRFISGIL